MEFAFCLFAVAITVWYAGSGPGVLAIVLSGLSVAYFFTEPLYSLHIKPADIPYFIIFGAFALLITWFSSMRRRIEQELREACDKLEIAEAKYRSIFENAGEGIFQLAPDGRYLAAKPCAGADLWLRLARGSDRNREEHRRPLVI